MAVTLFMCSLSSCHSAGARSCFSWGWIPHFELTISPSRTISTLINWMVFGAASGDPDPVDCAGVRSAMVLVSEVFEEYECIPYHTRYARWLASRPFRSQNLDGFLLLGYHFSMPSLYQTACLGVTTIVAVAFLSVPAGAVEIVSPKDGEVVSLG